jgi:hypothetical protein
MVQNPTNIATSHSNGIPHKVSQSSVPGTRATAASPHVMLVADAATRATNLRGHGKVSSRREASARNGQT